MKTKNNIYLLIIASAVIVSSFTQCKSLNNRQKGTVIGAGAGGTIGAVIGKQSGNTALGAIIGGAIGGTAGALVGNYMDKQAAELQRDLKGATVTRVGEGIKITFDSGILFDVNQSNLKPAAQTNITNLATVLKKYNDTEILIEGHTDASGSDELNQNLSVMRAKSVKSYASNLGVAGSRMNDVGYGETQPIDDNTTTSGAANNRRVEIAIMANDKLKRAAKKGQIGN